MPAEAAPKGDSASAPRPEHRPRTESTERGLTCGDVVCRAGEEVCCMDQNSSFCVSPTKADEHGDYPDCYWGTATCNDSDDCPAGQTCYLSPTERMRSRCEPSRGTAADWYEACTEHSTCRTPGTSCLGEVCRGPRPPHVRIDCGDAVCSGADICCVHQSNQTRHCSTSCEVQQYPISCRDGRDCAPGELCLIAPIGHQQCGKLNHGLVVACASDAECPEHPVCQLQCIDGTCRCP